MRKALALLCFVAAAASGAPSITSIAPNAGSVAAGTVVTITGTGFSNCIICSPPAPPAVFFGGTPARSVTLLGPTTLQATAPALLPATYDVTVQQFDGQSTLAQAYRVTGDPSEAFETILLPVYSALVQGAFGSLFETIAVASNKYLQPLFVYGEEGRCGTLPSPALGKDPYDPTILPATGQTISVLGCRGLIPARLLYIPRDQADEAAFNLRVRDVTRTASTLGTEIPIVRSARMPIGRIKLLNVPIDARYRVTLRIYATSQTSAEVRINGEPHQVALQPGADIFEPAYAQFTDFPVPMDPGSTSTIAVTIDPALIGNPNTGTSMPGPSVWAFITVTNKETQQITTITPD